MQDYRPAVVIDDVSVASFKDIKFIEPESRGKKQIFQHKSKGVIIQ
jgi:hypothetical protein